MQTTDELVALPHEKAAEAPILFFDLAPAFGVAGGVGRVTLSALINEPQGENDVATRKIVVAHLRGAIESFSLLRQAIESLELLAKPTDATKN